MKISQPTMMLVLSEDTEFPEPPVLSGHDLVRITVICNQKGGVGKTTTAINLSAALAGHSRRVLLVDFDPRGAASVGLGINDRGLGSTIYSLIPSGHHDMIIRDMIQNTGTENLDSIPANIDPPATELQLANEVARETILARALRDMGQDYDLVVIDCQPLLNLLTVDAFTAAHGVITPVATEFLALREAVLLMETINTMHDRSNPRSQLDGVSAAMTDLRTLHFKGVPECLTKAFQNKIFSIVINRAVKSPDSTVVTRPITESASTRDRAEAYRRSTRKAVTRRYVA